MSSAANAGSDRWKRGQSLLGNRLAALLTYAVAAIEESCDRLIDRYQVPFRPGQQRTDLRPFERDSRPLGIVFVVIGSQRGGLDDGVELAGQRRDAVQRAGPLGVQTVAHRVLLIRRCGAGKRVVHR